MTTCLFLGDSIAVGAHYAAPQCAVVAKVGISAKAFATTVTPGADLVADTTVISLGSNPGPHDEESIRAVRSKVFGKVVWFLPPARCRGIVQLIARERGDRVVDVRNAGATPEHIHPDAKGYAFLAARALQGDFSIAPAGQLAKIAR